MMMFDMAITLMKVGVKFYTHLIRSYVCEHLKTLLFGPLKLHPPENQEF